MSSDRETRAPEPVDGGVEDFETPELTPTEQLAQAQSLVDFLHRRHGDSGVDVAALQYTQRRMLYLTGTEGLTDEAAHAQVVAEAEDLLAQAKERVADAGDNKPLD